jgi:hypothetical protein
MYKGRKFWDVAKDERERKKFKPYLAWIMSKKDFKFLGKEAAALEKVVRDYLGLPRKRVGS